MKYDIHQQVRRRLLAAFLVTGSQLTLMACATTGSLKAVEDQQRVMQQHVDARLAEQTARDKAKQAQVDEQLSKIAAQWDAFSRAFDPATRQKLKENLEASQQTAKNMAEYERISQERALQVLKHERTAQESVDGIRKQEAEATAHNAVRQAEEHMERIGRLGTELQESARQASNAASRASENSATAARAATDAQQQATQAQVRAAEAVAGANRVGQLDQRVSHLERALGRVDAVLEQLVETARRQQQQIEGKLSTEARDRGDFGRLAHDLRELRREVEGLREELKKVAAQPSRGH